MAIERARELNRLACENISHGEIESACEKLLDAIRIAPNWAAPHTNLGVLYCWEGKLDESITLHQKTLMHLNFRSLRLGHRWVHPRYGVKL